MSAFPDRAIAAQAIAWHLRLEDADEQAWVDFADWLSADPAHNAAYEAAADGDARLSPVLASATFPSVDARQQPRETSNDDDGLDDAAAGAPVRRNRWRWGALAASIAVAGFVGVQSLPDRDASYAIETLAGETRTVSLADGSKIQLNGATRIVLDRNAPRSVEIARGEARFAVSHDDADPFTVSAGAQRLVDVGTVFNVVRTDRQLRVGVAEGAVRFEDTARTVNLRAGDTLAADGRGNIAIAQSPTAAIGSWASGKLVYDQVPLAQVADDLSRSVGIKLALPRAMSSRSFSGVIQTDGDRDTVRARVEELIGEKIVADGRRWSVDAR